jgi:hypothetical protein
LSGKCLVNWFGFSGCNLASYNIKKYFIFLSRGASAPASSARTATSSQFTARSNPGYNLSRSTWLTGSEKLGRAYRFAAAQVANLRYSRLPVCATTAVVGVRVVAQTVGIIFNHGCTRINTDKNRFCQSQPPNGTAAQPLEPRRSPLKIRGHLCPFVVSNESLAKALATGVAASLD